MQQDKGHYVPCTTMRNADITAPPLLAELMGEPWVQPQRCRDEDGVVRPPQSTAASSESSVKERRGSVGVLPEKGHKNDLRDGDPTL